MSYNTKLALLVMGLSLAPATSYAAIGAVYGIGAQDGSCAIYQHIDTALASGELLALENWETGFWTAANETDFMFHHGAADAGHVGSTLGDDAIPIMQMIKDDCLSNPTQLVAAVEFHVFMRLRSENR